MQSSPGDRQPLENQGFKSRAAWEGGGGGGGDRLSATSHTTCIGPSNTYSGHGLEKKERARWWWWLRVCLCAHTSVRGFVLLLMCALVSGTGLCVDDERQWSNRIDAEVIVCMCVAGMGTGGGECACVCVEGG